MDATGDLGRTEPGLLSEEVWMPQDVKLALSLQDMPVIHYEETTEEDIISTCLHSHHIGLTYIRLVMDDIFLVCLTLEDRIFVLNLKLAHQLRFFIELSEQKIKFYSVKGHLTNYRLLELANVNLSNLIDLTAYDIFLSMRKTLLGPMKSLAEKYTLGVINERGLVYRDKYDLIKRWLGVNLAKRNRLDEIAENDVIKKAPLSLAARNVIRSRSCFYRTMALRMSEDYRKLATLETDKLYSFAIDIEDDDYRVLIAQYESKERIPYSRVMNCLNRCRRE